MGSQSLLDRAKEFGRGKGVLTALAIAPLAMATEVRADVVFQTPTASFSTFSGGKMGHIGQSQSAFFPAFNGVSLNGNTNITDLVSDPDFDSSRYSPNNPPSGYVSAMHVGANFGHVVYNWGQDYDGVSPDSLSGHVGPGDFLSIGRNFSVATPGSSYALTWTLKARVVMADLSAVEYELDSPSNGLGTFAGLDSVALPEGDLKSWSVQLDFAWDVGSANEDKVSRLEIEIPSAGPSAVAGAMYISIDHFEGGEGVPAPLPATVWASGSLLGLVGIGRLRKSRR